MASGKASVLELLRLERTLDASHEQELAEMRRLHELELVRMIAMQERERAERVARHENARSELWRRYRVPSGREA